MIDSVKAVFDFIYSLLDTIISGIYGVIDIISSVIQLIISICKIIPNPLYSAFLFFISLYLVIFTYKIFRKG